MTLVERIDEIDKMLFDASVMVFGPKTNANRDAVHRTITDARVELVKLQSQVGRR